MITQYPYKNKISFHDWLIKNYPSYAKKISDVKFNWSEPKIWQLEDYYSEYHTKVILKKSY
jgi:hypothetical protein